jgi:hypothetical protein
MGLLLLGGGGGLPLGPEPEPEPEPVPLQARAGLAYAGVTHAGLTNFQLAVRVAGTDRGMKQNPSFRINHTMGRPSSCTFQCHFPVASGDKVEIACDGAKQLIFGGTVNRVTRPQQSGVLTTYDVSCLDWIWLANKDTRIHARFVDVSLNTAVSKVLGFVEPALGIRPGRIPGDLGTVNLVLDGVNLEQALNELARARTVSWRLTPHKRVDMFREDPAVGNDIELVDDTSVKLLGFEEKLDQVRTQVQGTGGGSQVEGFHPYGSTSLAVKETGWYSTSGGFVKLVGLEPLPYGSVSAESGPGFVTGVVGLHRDVSDGETLSIYAELDDLVAQAALAARFGGGISGVVAYQLNDGRVNLDTLLTEMQRNLDFLKNPVVQADFAMSAPHFLWNKQRRWEVGRLVPTDIESDEGDLVQGTFRISDVTLEGLADVVLSDGTTYSWQVNRTVRFRPGSRFGVIDLLVQS